jgi:hypothetical protein
MFAVAACFQRYRVLLRCCRTSSLAYPSTGALVLLFIVAVVVTLCRFAYVVSGLYTARSLRSKALEIIYSKTKSEASHHFFLLISTAALDPQGSNWEERCVAPDIDHCRRCPLCCASISWKHLQKRCYLGGETRQA